MLKIIAQKVKDILASNLSI